jgi:hypothetical protein
MMEAFTNAPFVPQNLDLQQQQPQQQPSQLKTCQPLPPPQCIYTTQGELQCGGNASAAAGGGCQRR